MTTKILKKLITGTMLVTITSGYCNFASAEVTVIDLGGTTFSDPLTPPSSSSIDGTGDMNYSLQTGLNPPLFTTTNPTITIPIIDQTWGTSVAIGSIEVDKDSDTLCLQSTGEFVTGVEYGISATHGGATKALGRASVSCYKGAKKYIVDAKTSKDTTTTGGVTVSFTTRTYRA